MEMEMRQPTKEATLALIVGAWIGGSVVALLIWVVEKVVFK
jgi:hypothetical protein